MSGAQPVMIPGNVDPDETKKFLLKRYDESIAYYWKASRENRLAYKTSRYLMIVLGAVVTLISSLASAEFVKAANLTTLFGILTPVLAAMLAIAGGFSQSFQWGAAWSEMVITAERLSRERDRVTVTPASEIDAAKELQLLNDLVLSETRNFFERILGTQTPTKG